MVDAVTYNESHILTAEDRATMFIEWCAISAEGPMCWPEGAHRQLVAHFEQCQRPLLMALQLGLPFVVAALADRPGEPQPTTEADRAALADLTKSVSRNMA